MSKRKKNNTVIFGKYSICNVFQHMDASPANGQHIKFYGHSMHLRSTRLLNFRVHGIRCVECGIQGAYFLKEKHSTQPVHLNLYGFDKQGQPVLMTRDHIKPKSKNGTNNLYNSQPMCRYCNFKKGDKWSFKDKLRYICRQIKRLFKKEYK